MVGAARLARTNRSATNLAVNELRRKVNSSHFWRNGRDDRRGRTFDGMMWRSADFPGLSGTAIYDGVSKEVATTYDEVIDSACQLEQMR